MGRPPDHANAGTDRNWARPPENVEAQGCPGAWYRTAWFASVAKYCRRRTDDGNRVENRLLSMTSDPLIIEAVEALETFQEQARDEYLRVYHAEQARKQKARQQ